MPGRSRAVCVPSLSSRTLRGRRRAVHHRTPRVPPTGRCRRGERDGGSVRIGSVGPICPNDCVRKRKTPTHAPAFGGGGRRWPCPGLAMRQGHAVVGAPHLIEAVYRGTIWRTLVRTACALSVRTLPLEVEAPRLLGAGFLGPVVRGATVMRVASGTMVGRRGRRYPHVMQKGDHCPHSPFRRRKGGPGG